MTESDNQPPKLTRRTLLGGAATAAVAVVQTSFAKGFGTRFPTLFTRPIALAQGA